MGARLELYGPWGLQIREVRSGESYGMMNSFTQHFGLGTATQIDSLVIRWPSGQVETVTNNIVNNTCISVTEIPIGILSEPIADVLSIYPNPTTGIINVVNASGTIEVLDIYGRIVLETRQKIIDLTTQPSGIYFLRVGQAVMKLVVQ